MLRTGITSINSSNNNNNNITPTITAKVIIQLRLLFPYNDPVIIAQNSLRQSQGLHLHLYNVLQNKAIWLHPVSVIQLQPQLSGLNNVPYNLNNNHILITLKSHNDDDHYLPLNNNRLYHQYIHPDYIN